MSLSANLRTVRIVCWETGSGTALAPVVRSLHDDGCDVAITALPPARDVFARRCGGLFRFEDELPVARTEDVVIAGLGAPRHRDGWRMWHAACGRAPSLGFLDHGKCMERFFTAEGAPLGKTMPTRIAAPTNAVAEDLVSRGLAPERVVVTGSTALEEALACADQIRGKRPTVRHRLGIPHDATVAVIASEGLHAGHTLHHGCNSGCHPLERGTIDGTPVPQALMTELQNDRSDETVLVLRPHPNLPATDLPGIRTVPWSAADDTDILAIADRVYGVSSMLLMQAAALGIDAVNIASRIDGWVPATSVMSEIVWKAYTAEGLLGGETLSESSLARHVGATVRTRTALETLVSDTLLEHDE